MAFATAAVTLLVLGSATGARAAITVANQNDSGPGSLRQAVAEAPPGETIVVPAGTYTLTSEPLKLLKSVTIAGHGSADTIVRSGGPFRVITILGPLDATIGGLTIRDGSGATSVVEGAGILSEKANLTLRDSVVTKNFANTDGAPGVNGGVALGGGFYVEGGALSLIDSKVIGNAATGVGGSGKNGGVVEGAGVWTSKATVTVSNSTISGNLLDVRGGQGSSTPAQNGGVAEGGGLWVDGALSIANSAVNGNTATAVAGHGSNGGVAEGGGLWAVGPLRIMNSTISCNLVDARGGQGPADPAQNGGVVQGGGVWAVQSTSDPSSVAGSTIGDNVIDSSGGPGAEAGVGQGAGIWEVADKAPVSFADTTLAFNVARNHATAGGVVQGGGLWGISTKTGSLSLTSMTISSNRFEASNGVLSGGDLYLSGTVRVRNSIVANGIGSAGSENCNEPMVGSQGFNLDSRDQCGFHSPGDQVNKDPLLGPLQPNGGPTPTMAPAPDGPAIDQGAGSGLAADQRGAIRPLDFPSIPNPAIPGADGSDVGAFELQPSNAFSLGKVTKNKKKGTATLTVTLPQPSVGTLSLGGKGLKAQTLAITGQPEAKLTIATKGGARKALLKKGKRSVGIQVTYAPPATTAAAHSLTTKLVRKHKKRHHKKHNRR